MDEIWKPIEGWENYQISTHGRIRSMRRWVGSNTGQRLVGGSLRKTVVLPNGKLTVTISDGNSKTFCVDVLVAKHFILNPNGYKNVQHRDGNQLNCNINNLQWSPKRARAQPASPPGTTSGAQDCPRCRNRSLFPRSSSNSYFCGQCRYSGQPINQADFEAGKNSALQVVGVRSDWATGQYTYQAIATKYQISTSTAWQWINLPVRQG